MEKDFRCGNALVPARQNNLEYCESSHAEGSGNGRRHGCGVLVFGVEKSNDTIWWSKMRFSVF